MKVSMLTALESPSARAQQIARQIFVYGRPLSLEEMIERIDAIGVEDVRRGGAAMLASAPTVAAIGGVGKALDQPASLRAWAGAEAAPWRSSASPGRSIPNRCCAAAASTCGRRLAAIISPGRVLREQSRAFLTPWEPTWPDDDLTRAAFRRRLRRQAEEMARDESYAFLIFDATSDALLGGLTIGGIRRGVAQAATLGYWMGAPHAGKGHMTRAVAAVVAFGFSTLRLHRIEAACIPGQCRLHARCLSATASSREGLARAYLKSTARGAIIILFALSRATAARLALRSVSRVWTAHCWLARPASRWLRLAAWRRF